MRKKIINTLFIIFFISLFLTNVTYAAETDDTKSCIKNIKKEIKQLESLQEQDITKNIELNTKLLEYQKQLNMNDDAIKTSLLLENLNTELYGKYSEQVFWAKNETLNLYWAVYNMNLTKQKLDELEEIALNSNDDIKTEYYNSLCQYYANFEDFNAVDKILFSMYQNSSLPLGERINTLSKLAANSSYNRDVNATDKYLKEYYNLLSKIENPYGQLHSYYMRKIYLNNDVQNLYKDFLPLYEQAKMNIDKIPAEENPANNISNLNMYLTKYYFEMGEFEKAKNIIEKYSDANINDLSTKLNLYEEYYNKTKNFESRKKTIDEIFAVKKDNDDYNSFDLISVKEKYGDLYKDKKDYDKSEKIYLNIIDLIDKYHNGNPARKYVYYNKLAELNLNAEAPDKALEYLKLARDAYKQNVNSFAYAKELYNKGKALNKKKDFPNALLNLTAAEKIQSVIPTNSDLADTYEELYNACAGKGDFVNALKYADKNINIRKQEYGDNNVKVYAALKNKADLIERSGQNEEADEIRKNIIPDYETGKIQGEDYDFNFDINIMTADKYLQTENFDKALNYTKTALKYAYKDSQYKQYYLKMSDIYGRQGKKALKIKYKALAAKY